VLSAGIADSPVALIVRGVAAGCAVWFLRALMRIRKTPALPDGRYLPSSR
jgi:hypothetical protein